MERKEKERVKEEKVKRKKEGKASRNGESIEEEECEGNRMDKV